MYTNELLLLYVFHEPLKYFEYYLPYAIFSLLLSWFDLVTKEVFY
jgi:hypothetical protein